MKKRIFSFLSVMLSALALVSVIGADAASFTFTANEDVPSATVENNVVTLTSSKGMIETAVSGVDLTQDVYISIQVESPIKNLDIFANYYSESSCRLAYKVKDEVSKIGSSDTTLTEYNDLGDSLIVTCKVDDKLEELGITELNKVLVWLRGTSGDVVEILNFAITTDGVHGFESSSETEEPVEPEVPAEPSDFNFVAVSGATGENNVFTLTSSKGYVEIPLTGVDLSSVYVSIKLTTITNFDITASGVTTAGETVTDSTVVYKAAELPWNVTEYETYGNDEFLIVTAYIHTYLTDFADLTSIKYILRGASGDVCEILDFAITTDGVHGFDTTTSGGEEPVEPEQPVEPETPVEYVFTTDGNATLEGNVYTMTSTRALLNLDVTGMNLDLNKLFVSLKYNFSSDAEGFEIRYSGIDAEGNPIEGQDAVSVVKPNTTAGSPWNLTDHVIYDDYTISTAQIDNYTSSLQSLTTITIRLKGVVGTTFELLDFNLNSTGQHGFDVPMSLGSPVGHGMTITETQDGYELAYNIDNGGWQYVEFAINSYEAKYNILNLVLDVPANTNICVRLYYLNGSETYLTLRDHWGTSGIVENAGLVTLSYNVNDLGLQDKVLTKVEIYLDNPTGTTVNTGETLVKLVKYELIDAAMIIVAAQEAAIAELAQAIGTYEINVEDYVAGINAATTLEAIETAKVEALAAIELKKAEIDELNALNVAKEGSILLLEEYIVGYEIDITSYKEQILAATTQDEIKSIFNTAKAYVFEKIEEIDAANSLSNTKASAITELEAYKAAELYREAEQAQLAQAVEAGKAAIQAALTEAEVAETLAQAKAVIDGIKTKAQYEAEEAEAAAKALEAVKTTAKEELASYKSSELYREAEQAQLAQAVEAGKAAIDEKATAEEVANALASAKAAIDGIKTKAEYEVEEAAKALADAKAAAKEELASYKSSELYREAEQAQLAQAVEAGKAAIDEKATTEEVASALASAKAAIDGIKTKAEYEAEEAEAAAKALAAAKTAALADITAEIGSYEIDKTTYEQSINGADTVEEVASALASALEAIQAEKAAIDAEANKGCGGSILPAIMGVVTLLGATLIVRRKKEE